ncbi:MAG: hypothetical protein OEY64_08575 [Nitrospinota bacterium]|nr:hypothetical protein [Nitrospinota bacterium]
MAVLTKDKKTERKQGIIFELPVAAAVKIFAGSLVSANSAGYLVPSSDSSSETFLGVARRFADNSAGANGDVTCEGYLTGIFEVSTSAITQSEMLKDAFVVDDNSVGKGIVAQPANVTGVTLARTALSTGGTRTLAFTATGTLLSYGGGTAVNVGTDGSYTLTATDGSNVIATVVSASLPGTDQSDSIQLRSQKVGRIIEVVSASSCFIDISTAARS